MNLGLISLVFVRHGALFDGQFVWIENITEENEIGMEILQENVS